MTKQPSYYILSLSMTLPSQPLDPKYQPLLDQLKAYRHKVKGPHPWLDSVIRGMGLGYVSGTDSVEYELDKLRSEPELLDIFETYLFLPEGKTPIWTESRAKQRARDATRQDERKKNLR